MHSPIEIENAASALANQLSAGISVREAVGRMAKLQPKHAELWQECSVALGKGGRLSVHLEGVWPDSVVAAIKAGEESGMLEQVFRRTQQSMQVKQQVAKVYSKLISPVVSFLVGLGVFLFFMILVIPKLAESLGGGEHSFVLNLATTMSKVFHGYWPVILGVGVLAIASGIYWFKQPENVQKLITLANSRPRLGAALRSLYFGMWANQLALLDTAGLPIKQQLLLSMKTLPDCYQEGVQRMAYEVEKRGIADSADPDRQEEGDPRIEWPFYITTAFITAHETGHVNQEMERCGPILIDEGIRNITKVMTVADLFAKIAAAAMIAAPLLAYFSQMANSLTANFS